MIVQLRWRCVVDAIDVTRHIQKRPQTVTFANGRHITSQGCDGNWRPKSTSTPIRNSADNSPSFNSSFLPLTSSSLPRVALVLFLAWLPPSSLLLLQQEV